MNDTGKIVVFSDLDGTLLDHETYSHAAAAPALERLRRDGIELVLASSKTAAEIAPLRSELGFADCPAIVENGAGVLEARSERPREARCHDRLLADLDRLPPELRALFSGFSEWDCATLRRGTGLDTQEARRAAQRDFSEPGLWLGSDGQLQDFLRLLGERKMSARRGGRFLTLSYGADKALRLREIAAHYRRSTGAAVTTIALGDAPNDAAMLEAADFGIIVANPSHAGLGPMAGEAEGRIGRTDEAGPAGWNAGLMALLDRLRQSEGENDG